METANIFDLNMLKIKLETMDENEKSLALSYCSFHNITDPLAILNVCEQVEDFSYLLLDADISGSKEERLGHAIVEGFNMDVKTALEKGYFLDDDTFLFYGTDPDKELYSREELADRLNDPRLWTFRKAEEQIEDNYNMIDGTFNNMEQGEKSMSRLEQIRRMPEKEIESDGNPRNLGSKFDREDECERTRFY